MDLQVLRLDKLGAVVADPEQGLTEAESTLPAGHRTPRLLTLTPTDWVCLARCNTGTPKQSSLTRARGGGGWIHARQCHQAVKYYRCGSQLKPSFNFHISSPS
jgi:hypothetical protein